MIKIHREGIKIVTIATLLIMLIVVLCSRIAPLWLFFPILAFLSVILILVFRFFRIPKRQFIVNEDVILAPADGKIVAIEKTMENEYFKEEKLLVSIFMSVHNVHINWFPVSGKISYFKYHPGKYLLARNPKSSELNESTSVVIQNQHAEIMVRQIAGYVARRIVCYANPGRIFEQSDELGFIRFGSRVDIFLPPSTQLQVALGDKTAGGQTIIASL